MVVGMRRDLAQPVAAFSLPDGLILRTFTSVDAEALHALFELAYADGGGGVMPFHIWWPSLRDDEEFEADLCWLVEDAGGRLIGAAQCWTSGFIKDLAIHPDYRGKQIASSLLSTVFVQFLKRGAPDVRLKVLIDNPAAIALYAKHGMRPA